MSSVLFKRNKTANSNTLALILLEILHFKKFNIGTTDVYNSHQAQLFQMHIIYHMMYVLIIIWRFLIFGHLWQCIPEINAGLLSGVYKYIQNNTSLFKSNFVFHWRHVGIQGSNSMTWKNSGWKYKYKNLIM